MITAAVLQCLEKASEMDRRAEQARDDQTRNAYLRLAENWRLLAESHRRAAGMGMIGKGDRIAG